MVDVTNIMNIGGGLSKEVNLTLLKRRANMNNWITQSAYTWPPQLNNGSLNFSLKKNTPTGLESNELTMEEYLKLTTYAVGSLSDNMVNNVESVMLSPFLYGYDELDDDSSANVKNSGTEAIYYYREVNALPSSANCDGQAYLNYYLLSNPTANIPIANSLLNTNSALPPAPGCKYFSETILAGKFIPGAQDALANGVTGVTQESVDNLTNLQALLDATANSQGIKFEKIENGKTYAERLFTDWAGLTDETSNTVSFGNLTSDSVADLKAKLLAYNTKVYKIERLQQYGVCQLGSKLVAEILTRAEGDLSMPGNDLSINGFPSITNYIDLIKDLVAVAVTNLNADPGQTDPVTYADISTYYGGAANMGWTFALDPPTGFYSNDQLVPNPLGGMGSLYLVHIMSMLLMCNDSELTQEQRTAFKGLAFPGFKEDGTLVDGVLKLPLNFDKNTALPTNLANVPVMIELWTLLSNTYTLNNNGNVGGSSVPLTETLLGNAIINAFSDIHDDVSLTTPDKSKEQVYEIFKPVSFLTDHVFIDKTLRFKPTASIQSFACGILDNPSVISIAAICNGIIVEFETKYKTIDPNHNLPRFFPTLTKTLTPNSYTAFQCGC
jgi:hypothetical protein